MKINRAKLYASCEDGIRSVYADDPDRMQRELDQFRLIASLSEFREPRKASPRMQATAFLLFVLAFACAVLAILSHDIGMIVCAFVLAALFGVLGIALLR